MFIVNSQFIGPLHYFNVNSNSMCEKYEAYFVNDNPPLFFIMSFFYEFPRAQESKKPNVNHTICLSWPSTIEGDDIGILKAWQGTTVRVRAWTLLYFSYSFYIFFY